VGRADPTDRAVDRQLPGGTRLFPAHCPQHAPRTLHNKGKLNKYQHGYATQALDSSRYGFRNFGCRLSSVLVILPPFPFPGKNRRKIINIAIPISTVARGSIWKATSAAFVGFFSAESIFCHIMTNNVTFFVRISVC
jgi:hypothetical protein